MNLILVVAAAPLTEIGAQVLTTIITFLLVLWTLKKLAWGPITEMLDERRNQVTGQFDEIDRKMAEANALIADYERRIRNIDDEGRQRMNRVLEEARSMSAQITERARQEAQEINRKAREAMELELSKARVELRREVVEMTLEATGKLLSVSLDDERHRQLIAEFIDDLEKRETS